MMKHFSQSSGLGGAETVPDQGASARASRDRSSEQGAILILALAYLVMVGLVVALLSTWVSNNLNNSTKFSAANSLTVAASGMTDLAIQYVRYNPLISDSTTVDIPTAFVPCWGGTSVTAIQAIDGDQVAVWCSTVWNPLVAQTRTVTFDACPIAVTKNACTANTTPPNWLLSTTAVFDDYPPAPALSAPIQTLCTVYCGEGMTILNWQWGSSAGGSASTGVAASLSFTNEPSDTNAQTPTQASVTVVDANNVPVVGDTVTLVQQSGPSSSATPPVPGVSSPTSTLTAVTDSDGIAEFTNIVPQLPGAYTLTAVDGSASATSSTFQVGEPRAVITTSNAPTNATQGVGSYQVTEVTSSGDTPPTLSIADTTTSVCALNQNTLVVTFVSAGTCTLTFNDPGNANFAPALQVTQSFQVGGQAATQVGIVLGTTTPVASSKTNDSVAVTLENAVGAPVKSAGTTVVLSDVGSGFFAVGNGTTGASTYTLTIPTGQTGATVYFGGETSGPDSISVANGATVWGTAALTIVSSGTVAEVGITPNTQTPGVSSTTNTTLTLQLEDQYGNPDTSATPITLSLSTGTGYFAGSLNATGMSTTTVQFASGQGSATVFFGDVTSGSDMVTAVNGSTTWGTSTMTLSPGAASQVQITLSPTTPQVSTHNTTNTTVALQLEDQFGNPVQTAGVVFTLTNSATGFFAKTSGVGGTPSVTLNGTSATNMNGLATGYFGDTTAQSDTITATGTGTYSGISSTTSPFTV